MKLERAAQQALEALCQLHFAATERDKKNRVRWFDKAIDESVEAITALREALDNPEERGTNRYEGWVEVAEQAEHEPVAWMNTNGAVNKLREAGWAMNAAPVRVQDLTDEEIWDALTSIGFGTSCYEDARAVIAKDREKNK